jgi:outer membrane immunogenic protein
MKKFLLATVSMVALTSVTRGADMPVKAPVLAPVPMTNWTGGYLGIQGGILRRDTSMKFPPVEPARDLAISGLVTSGNVGDRTGAAVGGQLGYNWQQGRFVYGLEGDWNWIGAKTHSRSFFTTSSYDIDWLATVRGRVGLALDTTLFYVTGGAAFGRVKDTYAAASDFLSDNVILFSYTQDKTKLGWTLGAGVEHRFAPHWTTRAEFRYVDLGRTSAACTPGALVCDVNDLIPERADFRNSLAMGLVGLNYTFADARSPGWAQAQAYAPPSSPAWAGTYFGIQGGIARRETSFAEADTFLTGASNPDFIEKNRAGGTVGGLLGYNWQNGSFVYGVEGDWNWIGAKASRSVDFFGDQISASFDVNWLATLRGRAGLAFDALLFYVTGGLAAGHIRNSAELQLPFGSVSFNQSQTRVGWTAGVGAEYMFSPHWTARAEFRYVDLGTKQVSCTVTGSAGCTFPNSDTPYRGDFSNKLMLGLVGLAYKF